MAESGHAKTPTLAEQWSLPETKQQPAPTVVPVEKETEEEPIEVNSADVVEEVTDVTPETSETETTESAEEEVAEEQEIKIETAPADFRFPTTNQTRHCFTRYVEYHKCVAAKGDGASECDKFAKYYRSLCPGEWVDRWNEQRENGTFPGPL